MPDIVRVDSFATPVQLTKATLATANVASQPWANDARATAQPTTGVLVQSDMTNAAGTFIEVGGSSVTPGNGIQLGPGDTDLINVPNPAQIWAIPSVNNMLLRGQVR